MTGTSISIPGGYEKVSRDDWPTGWVIYHAGEADSTNADCRLFAQNGGSQRSAFIADIQRAGRGRRGRTWISPLGNLYCSALLRPNCDLAQALTLGYVAGVALRSTLATVAPESAVRLKWPNDILVNDRKIAGVLLESSSVGDKCEFVAIGVGVNIASAPAMDRPVASLSEFCPNPDVHSLCAEYLRRLDRVYQAWEAGGFNSVKSEWESCAVGIGEIVSIENRGELVVGRFLGLDDKGAMLVDTGDIDRESTVAEIAGLMGSCRRVPSSDIVRITVGDVMFHGAGTSRRRDAAGN